MLSYDIVDVFTDRPFAGNQLAVVHGAGHLTTEQCLALAQEFSFSETTFPEPSSQSAYRTRIFTPGGEIPFAGYPTLGTAWVLREHGLLSGDEVVQHCGAGEVAVRFSPGEGVELSVVPRDLVGPLDDPLVAAVLADVGLSVSDLAGPVWAAGCGLTFVHVPVAGEAVGRAVASSRPLAVYAERLAALGPTADPVEGINLHHVSGRAPDLRVHARVFVPGLSVAEDPATGSAAAGLGLALVASGVLPDGGRYTISQGAEIARPSRIEGNVEAADGTAVRCQVAGQVHAVASGGIAVPAPG